MTQESGTPVSAIEDLRPKMELKGTVKQIEIFGAFVDIGVGQDGLLHISQLRREHTDKIEDVLQVGQEITVWVRKVDGKAKRIDLTMIAPLEVEWHELKPGQVRKGKVVRLEKFGAFVDIGAERPGMVHVRELATGYVKHPSEIVSLGDEVEVKVVAVNRKKRQIDLSMKALEVEDIRDIIEEDGAPPQTAMEVALRAAMGEAESGSTRQKKKKKKAYAAEREDIFKRTLAQHRDS